MEHSIKLRRAVVLGLSDWNGLADAGATTSIVTEWMESATDVLLWLAKHGVQGNNLSDSGGPCNVTALALGIPEKPVWASFSHRDIEGS